MMQLLLGLRYILTWGCKELFYVGKSLLILIITVNFIPLQHISFQHLST
jgi:hypothetical protein